MSLRQGKRVGRNGKSRPWTTLGICGGQAHRLCGSQPCTGRSEAVV
ncbi:MAG: hypothetical protein MZV64_00140 [Ignavibacteriales bacterium]|nr:hypothetical protein [Ignavibacteriales bacterium]